MRDYDAIVIGGGHAGIEAGLALARMGAETLLVTQSADTIGRMSCNPSIGGLAKGNLVREIDALGGEMGHLIDSTMIQMRMLNKRRGPAVQAPRAQADKFSYSRLAKETLEGEPHLHIFMDTVVDIMTEDGRASGVAIGLGDSLRSKGFHVGRMKTGTPARVRKSSLDFSRMEVQPGDVPMLPFSFENDEINRPDIPCYITYTNESTHQIIRDNIRRSPLYGGKIVGKGPRYCPSIEDKVVRFPDRDRHQIFVEPEGEGTEEMYLNGLSSSLPEEVQHDFIHTLPGLEYAEIIRPGYAVEYDYLDPLDLYPSLESKIIPGLFIAGQTNGTSGYEEAAAQGLVAGINAALYLRKEKPLILKRTDSYIGVLIDDLVTKGTKEPYRMFTSRAEHRLSLRHDTADQRLTPVAASIGLASKGRMEGFERKMEMISDAVSVLKSIKADGKSLYEKLREPDADVLEMDVPELSRFPKSLLQTIELDVRYEGYLKRQEREVEKAKKQENMVIPPDFDYDIVDGISSESKEKLKAVRPLSIGQASRISGVRVSDIAVLAVAVRSRSNG